MKSRNLFLLVAASALATAVHCAVGADSGPVEKHESLKPIGEAKGIHPGRVVWVHDPQALDWKGPGDESLV